MARPRASTAALFLVTLTACGPRGNDAREAPQEAAGTGLPLRTLQLSLGAGISLPEKAAISVLGYADTNLAGGWPVPGARPAFFWTTGARSLDFPITLDVPLPSGLSLFVTVDSDGNGVPGPGDQMAAPLLSWSPPAKDEPIPLRIDRAFDPSAGRDRADGDGGGPPLGMLVPGGGDPDAPPDLDAFGAPGDTLPRAQGQAPDPGERMAALRLIAESSVRMPPSAAIFVLGYPAGSLGAGGPRPGLLPGAYFPVEAGPIRLPATVNARVTSGLDLLVIIDGDGDGVPGPGDLISEPLPRFEPKEGVATDVRIRGGFAASAPSAQAAAAPNGVLIGPDGSATPGGGKAATLSLSFAPGFETKAGASVFVLAYDARSLENGQPKAGSRPTWFFESRVPAGKGPHSLEAQAPVANVPLVLVDADGDGVPGPGDLLGRVDASKPGTLDVKVDARFTTAAPTLAEAETRAVSAAPSTKGGPRNDGPRRTLKILLEPPLAKPKSAGIFVLGYPDGALEGDLPRPGIRPLFAWQSPPLEPIFPITVEAPLPDGGLTLLLVLDGDASNEPGPGDLMAAPQHQFRPPAEGQSLTLILDRAFAPATPEKAPPGSEARGEGDESLLPAWLRPAP